MSTKSKHIIKFGKIQNNHLIDFPQHISVNPNSYYQLLIDNKYLILTVDLTDANDLIIDLPFIKDKDNEYNCIINWGDNTKSNVAANTFNENKRHEYETTGKYTITISGICPGFNNYMYELSEGKNAWKYLIAVNSWRRSGYILFSFCIL